MGRVSLAKLFQLILNNLKLCFGVRLWPCSTERSLEEGFPPQAGWRRAVFNRLDLSGPRLVHPFIVDKFKASSMRPRIGPG